MERIKQQFEQLQQQLAGLSASQKMLTAALVAIMAATVVWWAAFAAGDDKVVLLDQALSADQLGGIQSALAAANVPYAMQADRLMVATSRRQEALATLTYERLMPADTTNHFEKAIGQMGSFDSRQKIDTVQVNALQNELGGILRRMRGVRSASVLINPTFKARIGANIEPSASVDLATSGGGDAERLADAAAHAVAGAVSMLKPSNVTVIVDGRHVELASEDSLLGGAGRMLQVRAEGEKHFEEKVRRALGYIPGLHVSVGVEVNDTVTRKSEFKVDPTSKIVATQRETTQTENSENAGGRGAEAGLNVNAGLSTAGGANASGSTKTRESGESQSSTDYGKTREETYREAGGIDPVSCSLSVPMSWIVEQWRGRTRSASEPDATVLKPFEQQALDEIKQMVATSLQDLDGSRIKVVSYADGATLAAGGVAAALAGGTGGAGGGEAAAGLGGLVRDYGKQAALVALAGVALFLVSSMVKKAAPPAAPAPPTLDGQAVTLYGGGSVTNFAGETDSLLMAQEVGDDEVYAGQMLEQVQTLVKENPDAAAALVKRWLAAT